MSKKLTLLCIAYCLSIFSGSAMAERTLILGGPPWEPFLNERHANKGLSTEIVTQALNLAGYNTQVRITPWRRVLAEAKSGDIDILIGLWFSKEREALFSFSKPYYTNEIFLVARKGKNITFRGIDSLSNLRIGVRKGASFGKTFDQANYLNKIAVPNDMSMLQMLIRGRLDLGVGDKLILKNLIESDPALSDSLAWVSPALDNLPLHMAVSKSVADHAVIVKKFNAALKKMKDTGRLASIYQRYEMN